MGTARLLRVAAAAGVVAVSLSLAAAVSAAVPPTKAKCPSASVVGATLGIHLSKLTSKTTTNAKVCSYKTSLNVLAMTIQFQKETAASFAAGENAVAKSLRTTVKGLGKAAWGSKYGGFLAVFLGSESIRITAPGASLARLEKLARKLI